MNPADTCDVSATADTERGQINVQKHAIVKIGTDFFRETSKNKQIHRKSDIKISKYQKCQKCI